MSRFLLGALVMGAVFVLTSFALTRTAESPRGGPAWTVSQYQLDRAFRVKLPTPAGSQGSSQTLTSQIPPGAGLIITQIHGTMTVGVNGVEETFYFSNDGLMELNPPIIARPGDVLSVTYTYTPVIAGYTTLPGET
jgi:hypothetical protein